MDYFWNGFLKQAATLKPIFRGLAKQTAPAKASGERVLDYAAMRAADIAKKRPTIPNTINYSSGAPVVEKGLSSAQPQAWKKKLYESREAERQASRMRELAKGSVPQGMWLRALKEPIAKS
jgi:hypothetical protein